MMLDLMSELRTVPLKVLILMYVQFIDLFVL